MLLEQSLKFNSPALKRLDIESNGRIKRFRLERKGWLTYCLFSGRFHDKFRTIWINCLWTNSTYSFLIGKEPLLLSILIMFIFSWKKGESCMKNTNAPLNFCNVSGSLSCPEFIPRVLGSHGMRILWSRGHFKSLEKYLRRGCFGAFLGHTSFILAGGGLLMASTEELRKGSEVSVTPVKSYDSNPLKTILICAIMEAVAWHQRNT